jgi:putative PIN family toxin of toxin-antitoxin system
MISLRLVLDTNVVISAAIKPKVMEPTVLLLAIAKPVRWYVSEPIVAEYSVVLARPELRIRRPLQQQCLQWIRKYSHVVTPSRLPPITTDPGDNKFLECADAARADYLVTGNQRHFPKYWKSTKIIGSRDFLNLVAPHLLL